MNPFVLGNVNILLSMSMLGSLHAYMQEPYTIPHSLHRMIFTEDSLSMAGVKRNIKHVKKKKIQKKISSEYIVCALDLLRCI